MPIDDALRLLPSKPVKAPAFQFYADDFIGGTLTMTHEERGLYILALCLQWGQGSLAVEDVARLAGPMASASVARVEGKFERGPDGRLRNSRLEAEREKQRIYRQQQSNKGKASAQARFNHGSTTVQPSGQPKVNSPSPSPSPSPSSVSDTVSASAPHQEDPPARRRAETVWKFPTSIDTPEFRDAWDRWHEYRRQARKPKYTEMGGNQQLAKLGALGSARAVAAIENSIGNAYTGIFEQKESSNGNGNHHSSRPAGYEDWKSPPRPGDPLKPEWGTQAYIRKNGHGI